MSEEKPLKMETKLYDSIAYGYLYGLNQRIPDEEFEKVKPYFREFRRKDFVSGTTKITGRPDGWRCLEKDVPKVEEILGITDTLEKRWKKVDDAFKDPEKKQMLKDQCLDWLNTLFIRGGTQPKQDLSRLAIHSSKIYDPEDSFKNGREEGRGSLFIYTPHGMWYIKNNSFEGSDPSLNNVYMKDGKGAIGYRLMY
ncbi:hypothetical protein [uncultured Methanobrevibacter sp.]|nr:hypothetical protein [uncultured Methanobrevibacter sp.]